jgi:hypothetical protein
VITLNRPRADNAITTAMGARLTECAGNGRLDARPLPTGEQWAAMRCPPPWNRLGYGDNAVEVTYVDVR